MEVKSSEDLPGSKPCSLNSCTGGKCQNQMLLKPGGGYACGPGCKRYRPENFAPVVAPVPGVVAEATK